MSNPPTFRRAPRPENATAQTAAAPDAVRLNKRLADMGLCSRREADEWIERGWVRVNGAPAVMGVKVGPQDKVTVEREAEVAQAERVTILLNKPMGYVSGQAEDGHQPAVVLINGQSRWREDRARTRFAPHQLRGLAPAGRLDIDSVGLLVLTQDGRIARHLIGQDSEIEKEYLAATVGDASSSPSELLLWPLLDAQLWSYAVLAFVSKCCPPLGGRLLTCYSPVRH